jgi:hypothetical protein
MITNMTECPICFRKYETNPKVCECGFSELEFVDFFAAPTEESRRQQWFDIYKYAKKVYYGQIDLPRDRFLYREYEDCVLITDAPSELGISVVDVDAVAAIRDRRTVADAGLLAMQTRQTALLLNVDEVDRDFLDESRLRILFLGRRVRMPDDGGFSHQLLRYVFVDSENPYLTVCGNVLFNRDMTVLYCYPTQKPEEEYTVPASVRRIAPRAFGFGAEHLRRVRLSRKFRNHDSIRAWFGPEVEVEFY